MKTMQNIRFERTHSENQDFRELVRCLDADLDEMDKEQHCNCEQYNKLDDIEYVIVAYSENEAVACGAIREYAPDTMEIKRMYVSKNMRRKGIASEMLKELENRAKELGYHKCILETGKKMPDAIRLYEKNGYARIPNYGQYECIGGSLCFEKILLSE
jgi:GNAT superfamily N-acetyltransferase